jgi:Concanavalin A-like lectin/glucanases superfamily
MTALILVLVPVLVLAVVVLFAFAGCAQVVGVEELTFKSEPEDAVLSETSLRSFWRLGEAPDAPSRTAADSAPKHRAPGTYEGDVDRGLPGVLTNNTAADFHGVGGHVRVDGGMKVTAWVNPVPDPEPAFSIEAWINPTTTARELVVVSSYLPDPYRGFELLVRPEGTPPVMHAVVRFFGSPVPPNPATDPQPFEIAAPLGDGADHHGWRHVVGTCQTSAGYSTLELYVDGVPLATGPTNPKEHGIYRHLDATTNQPLWIGRRFPTWAPLLASESFFEGGIDEVALYGKALTTEAVEKHFDAVPK